MNVLMTSFTRSSDAFWPMHNHWVAHATLIGIAFESLEWRIAGPCPAPRIVVVGMLRTDVVNVLQVFFKTLGNKVVEVLLVVAAGGATFCRCTVVAHDDHDGVVEFAQGINEFQ